MKRLWLYTAFLLMGATGATNALAACPSSPLQNGTTANASQVMDWLDCKAPLDNPSFPGNVIINTALGISTGSPSGRLEIADSSQNAMAYISAFTTGAAQRAQLNLRKSATNTIGGLSPNAPGDTLGVISIWGVTSGGAWNDDAGGINVIQYGSAGSSRVGGTMNFFTGDGTAAANIRMSILGNGNIGIGTTAPSYTLDIAGGVNALRARVCTQ